MLAWTAQRLADPLLSQDDINAFLESFTIHTRALSFFFFAPPPVPQDRDVLAQDFMPAGVSWSNLAGAKPTALTTVAARVGTEIAHISYERLTVTPEAKKWKVRDITSELLKLVKTFAENADHLDSVWSRKPPAQTMEASNLSKSPSATNVVFSTSSTPPVQPPIACNTLSVQKLIIDTSGDFPPKDGD